MKALRIRYLLAVFPFVAGMAACDEGPSKPRPTEPLPAASVARLLGLDAGELGTEVDPAGPVGDLNGELGAFTTIDACVTQRSGGDPLVSDALQTIGYDTLVRDACRWLDAAKSRDAKRCSEIAASNLKARCVATVAELTASPDACPFDVPNRPELGRDATCLAIAARDPGLCAGALEVVARVTCQAVATHDPRRCDRLARDVDEARCVRDAKRWGAVLPASDAPPPEAGAPSATATVTGDAGGLGSGAFAIDVERGVVVLDRLEGPHFVVGKMTSPGLELLGTTPGAPRPVMMELVVPADPKKARLERLQLEPRDHPAFDLTGPKATAFVVHVARFERRRGAPVELTVEGPLAEGVHLKVVVTTFVRDTVTASAMLGAQGGGGAGGMR